MSLSDVSIGLIDQFECIKYFYILDVPQKTSRKGSNFDDILQKFFFLFKASL